jgi:FXSXX-COOH protein
VSSDAFVEWSRAELTDGMAACSRERASKVRSTMSEDVTDSTLIDVGELDLSKLREDADESGLTRALNRLLASDNDHATSFQANI